MHDAQEFIPISRSRDPLAYTVRSFGRFGSPTRSMHHVSRSTLSWRPTSSLYQKLNSSLVNLAHNPSSSVSTTHPFSLLSEVVMNRTVPVIDPFFSSSTSTPSHENLSRTSFLNLAPRSPIPPEKTIPSICESGVVDRSLKRYCDT